MGYLGGTLMVLPVPSEHTFGGDLFLEGSSWKSNILRFHENEHQLHQGKSWQGSR